MRPNLKNATNRLRDGSFVMLVDDLANVPVCYLLAAGELISETTMAEIINLGRGVIFAALSEERVIELGLPMMNPKQLPIAWDFTVSVESREGVSTGISAADRARTLKVLATTKHPRLELVMPGHIFPLKTHAGGVLLKSSAPEACLDLVKIACSSSCATISHLLDSKGQFLKMDAAKEISKKENIPLVTVSDVIEERLSSEKIIELISEANLPMRGKEMFKAKVFRSTIDNIEHLALIKGEVNQLDSKKQKPVLVRVQAENRLGDLFAPEPFPSRVLISESLEKIAQAPCGVFVYIRHRRKKLLQNQVLKLASGSNSDKEANWKIRQIRELGLGAQILSSLGVNRIRLIGSSKPSSTALSAYKLEIVETVPPLEGST